ncbi:MAG: CBS domain-containing protein, partial [Candidatus Moraniibacteriota bacterium]
MRSEVVSVAPDQLVQDVADVLMKRSIHGVPVIDAEDKVVGIVTESDFFMKDRATLHIPSFMDIMQKTMVAKALGDADRAIIERILSARVKDIMTSECLTVYEVTPLQDLLQIFATTHYKT